MAPTNHRKFIRRANPHTDSEGILAIYAPIVRDTPVTMMQEAPTKSEMEERILLGSIQHPWIVYEKNNVIFGFAYATTHKSRACYNWTADSGIYIRPDAQNQGIAKSLYEVLFETLTKQGYFTVIAGISLPNEASVKFHLSMGFELIGTHEKVGLKFGKWWDSIWFRKPLRSFENTPANLQCPTPFSEIDL